MCGSLGHCDLPGTAIAATGKKGATRIVEAVAHEQVTSMRIAIREELEGLLIIGLLVAAGAFGYWLGPTPFGLKKLEPPPARTAPRPPSVHDLKDATTSRDSRALSQ
jgi:hypothetical protein